MVNRNIQMKKKNNDIWENLFPITFNENVYDQEGLSLTEKLTNIEDTFDTIEDTFDTIDDSFTRYSDDLLSRGVNALNPPDNYTACKGNGIDDDTVALQKLIDDFDLVILPNRHYLITDTIYLKNRSKQLIGIRIPNGLSKEINDKPNGARLVYDGAVNRQKAMIVIGQNDVNEEPLIDASGLVLENVIVDGNNKIGFGVYGTYLTNETTVKHVIATKTLEYGFYFARSWYALFSNLVAKHNMGKGMSFGIPIEYQNNNKIVWNGTSSPIEMNNTPIKHIRAHSNGKYYSEENPNTFRITDATKRTKGYGIGLGVGSGFTCDQFISEANGGVNLYVYTSGKVVKSVKNGYLENAMYNSGIDPEEKTNILIEHTSETSGSPYEIRDVYMHYNSGGIHHTGGTNIMVWLRNIHQPRFLRSLDGVDANTLYSFILKDNVYSGAGTYNTNESLATAEQFETEVNTRYSWDFDVIRKNGGSHLVYIRLNSSSTIQPQSSIRVFDLVNDQNLNFNYTTLTNEWKLIRVVPARYSKFSFAGTGGSSDAFIDFRIVTMPATNI